MAEYNFDSFDEGAKTVPAKEKTQEPTYDLSSYDTAHAAASNDPTLAKQYDVEDQSNVSDKEAFGLNWGGPVTGIKQGATLGFGDEVAALSGALGAKSGGDDRPFWDVYKDILGTTRAEQKQVNTEHGTATTAGELVGGIVSPLSVVGGGALAKGAGLLAKTGKMAKVGAIGGAAIGLGNSEADLTSGDSAQVGQAVKDVGSSAATGAALGAGMQVLGSTIGSAGRGIKNIVGKLPVTDDIMTVFNKTRAGQELLGKAQQFSQENRELARNIINDMSKLQSDSGKAMGAATDQLNKSNAKVDVKKVVEGLRSKLSSLKASTPEERADIAAFQETLGNLIDETEQTAISFIKKPANPNLIDAETKAERTVAQKTAEAEVSDGLKVNQLETALESAVTSDKPNAKEITRLSKLLAKAKGTGDTQFPAQDIIDDVTGLPVKAVDRGLGKSPVVSAVMDPPESIFTPLQQVKTTKIVAGSPEANAEDALKLIRSLRQGIDSSETAVGKQAYGMGKDALDAELKAAIAGATPAKGAPLIKDTMGAYDVAKGGFSDSVSAKEMLGLPKSYDAFDNAAKVTDTNRIQNLIRDFHQGTQKSQVINESLDRLGQSFPDKAKELGSKIAEGSKNEYLANELSRGSEFARDPRKILASGKAALLQGARTAGKVAQTSDNVSKAITNLGTSVYNSSPQSLQSMASAAQSAGKSFAGVLGQVANAPMMKRKALLFTLMQQQDFRDFASQHVPFTSNGEDTDK